MEIDDLPLKIRWAAAYLADRYFLNEIGIAYTCDGYEPRANAFNRFNVDLALAMIAIERVYGADEVEPLTENLIYIILKIVSPETVVGKEPSDIDLETTRVLYELYKEKIRTANPGKTTWVGEVACQLPGILFEITEEILQSNDRDQSIELGRLIVETTEQFMKVVKRMDAIFGLDMNNFSLSET